MDWDKLRVFHAVAEAGSVTHAGETLHLSQSAVSRQISALERSVGAPLFHRHPRGLILTSEGEILFEATQDMVSQLASATGRIRGVREGVYGALRVTAPVDFGTFWLIPRLHKLFAMHPGLTIDLSLTEMMLDLPMREADVAIRMRAPKQADVIAKQLWLSDMSLYASSAYLDEAGRPTEIADLRDHDIIAYSPKSPQPTEDMNRLERELGDTPSLRARVIVNSQFGVLETVRNGVGIGMLPDYLGKAHGLERVIDSFSGPEIGVYFVYPKEMRRSKRIIVLRSFIEDELVNEKSANSLTDKTIPSL